MIPWLRNIQNRHIHRDSRFVGARAGEGRRIEGEACGSRVMECSRIDCIDSVTLNMPKTDLFTFSG